MTYPSREDTIVLLREWQKHHTAVEKMMDGIKATIGLDPNGPLFDTVWKLFDAYTNTLSVELGDLGGWLQWYQMENDMGANGHVVHIKDKPTKITTLGQLCELVRNSRKIGEA